MPARAGHQIRGQCPSAPPARTGTPEPMTPPLPRTGLRPARTPPLAGVVGGREGRGTEGDLRLKNGAQLVVWWQVPAQAQCGRHRSQIADELLGAGPLAMAVGGLNTGQDDAVRGMDASSDHHPVPRRWRERKHSVARQGFPPSQLQRAEGLGSGHRQVAVSLHADTVVQSRAGRGPGGGGAPR